MCLEKALEGQKRAWWVAPTYPVATIGWRFLKSLARQIPGAAILESERLVTLPTGGEVQAKSADNPDGLRGAGLDFVVIDEAAYVKEDAWTEALRPALSDRQGGALFISTPNGLNWFWKLFERAITSPGWARWQRPTWDNPSIAKQEIEAARAELGDVIFRQEFGAEFLDAATLKPFRRDWIRYWSQVEDDPLPADMVIEAGFDPAISKRDEACRSALVVAGQVRVGLERGSINVLRAVAGHWSVYEGVDVLLKAVTELHIRTVRVEDVAYQRSFGEVLDKEARQRGIMVHVDLVKPDGDKLRRAMGWSPLVEDGTVRFGPGQHDLIESMLAVPQDETKWDLVDAGGICVRGFPLMQGESRQIPGSERSPVTLAKGYATKPLSQEREQAVRPYVPRTRMGHYITRNNSAVKRAAGYAVRPRPKEPVGATQWK
jgi:predicted phage terminase large subunit-like protein